jgi:hypothetical protein
MYPELTQFKSWLKCQYSTSSASVHYSSDLALFFSYTKKSPSKITSHDVNRYISQLSVGFRPRRVLLIAQKAFF